MLPITSPPISGPTLLVAVDRGMSERPLSAVVLAAGEGTRMRSTRPKPLHLLCGRAMVLYVLDALAECDTSRAVIVVGHGAERVTKKLQEEAADLVARLRRAARAAGHGRRRERRAHRLPRRRPRRGGRDVLVLPGDTPLLRPETIGRAGRRAPPHRGRMHDPHRPARRPDRLRPDRPGQRRPGPPGGRAGRRHRRGAEPSTRSTRRSTASAAASWPRRCGA